jgi:hypothetical protein
MCQIVAEAGPVVAALSEGHEHCGLRASDRMSRREEVLDDFALVV